MQEKNKIGAKRLLAELDPDRSWSELRRSKYFRIIAEWGLEEIGIGKERLEKNSVPPKKTRCSILYLNLA